MNSAHGRAMHRLAGDEPRTTLALGALLAARHAWRDVRLLTAGRGARSLCPVVRAEAGLWAAYPVLGDVDDAAVLGAAINRSAASTVVGPTPDVVPLQPHLGRVTSVQSLPRLVVPWQPVEWEAPSAGTRFATALDLDALYELYEGYEVRFGRTRRGQQAAIREAVRHFAVIVLDGDGGRLDGAVMASTRTPRFIEWSQLTVRPEARGHGCSWKLMARAIAFNLACGIGVIAIMGPANPMTLPDLGTVDEITVMQLAPPGRIPGERLVRRAWFRLDRARHRRPLLLADAGRRPTESSAVRDQPE
jgi:GNAT superfamily N-acetyltransferase